MSRPNPAHHTTTRIADLTALADRLHAIGQPGLGEEFDRVAAEFREWAADRERWRAEVAGLRGRLAAMGGGGAVRVEGRPRRRA